MSIFSINEREPGHDYKLSVRMPGQETVVSAHFYSLSAMLRSMALLPQGTEWWAYDLTGSVEHQMQRGQVM
jgi:hypothetical protein